MPWINYLQDERAVAETPIPIGPIQVEVRLRQGETIEAIDWRYPEMKAPEDVEFEATADGVRFCIRRLIVHGMAVLRLTA